ncbi:uncharacterized protein CBL_14225 [Carabus blaptoides fortunei]
METHKKNIPEDRLVSLAQVFCNVEFLGCRYAANTMELVEQLANQVEAVRKYREDKMLKKMESALHFLAGKEKL